MTLRELLAAAGFTGAGLDTAVAVSRAESGGRATAHNDNRATGDNSYGLFQINMVDGLGPARRAQYGLTSNEALYDPTTNARVAFKMSKGGTNWGPWSTFKNGAYRAFLGTDATVSGSTSSRPGSSTTAAPASFGPSLDGAAGAAVRVVIIGTGIATGAALILLGLNKATGNPAGKAGKAAVTVAPLVAL